MQLGPIGEPPRAQKLARSLRGDGFDEIVVVVIGANRHELLLELDDEELSFTGHAFV
jgi:hypothetical protein